MYELVEDAELMIMQRNMLDAEEKVCRQSCRLMTDADARAYKVVFKTLRSET